MPTDLPSCISGDAMMKLGSNGTDAPVLDYNLPQTSSFVANVYLNVPVDPADFKSGYTSAPGTSYYDTVGATTTDQLAINIGNNYFGVIADQPVGIAIEGEPVTFSPAPLGNIADAAAFTFESGTSTVLNDAVTIAGVPLEKIALLAKNAMPVMGQNLAGQNVLQFIAPPESVTPQITIVEHYRVNTYLGDYGAGQTVKTFTLLPGEKTTISVKTYKQTISNTRFTENVLDSFTEESAKDLESIAENESNGTTTDSAQNSLRVGGGLNLKIPKIKIGVDAHADYTKSASSTRNETIKTLNRAISKQAQKSVNNRKIEVNTEKSQTTTESEETSTVRVLENLNKSRVLNFVFRQLNQELITVIYLDDVTFVFSNGYEEKKIACKLDGLYDMLTEVLDTGVSTVYANIINELANIMDYEGNMMRFVEKYPEIINDYFTYDVPGSTYPMGATQLNLKTQFRKDPALSTNVTGTDITVNGIVKNVTRRVIPTDSVIVDALLGQGEALDCYNMKLQEAATVDANLSNDIKQQMLDIIEGISDPEEKATLYKKVFGDCCDVPQSGCNCNTNNPE